MCVLMGNTYKHYNLSTVSHRAKELVAFGFSHRSLYIHTLTHTHTSPQTEKKICPALAEADAAMRSVISPTVAVATPTRGKSLIVCAHACVYACDCDRSLSWRKRRRRRRACRNAHCARLVSLTLYQWEYRTGPFQLSRQ